jgi:hypothetical protein
MKDSSPAVRKLAAAQELRNPRGEVSGVLIVFSNR